MPVSTSPLRVPWPGPLDYSRQSIEEPGTRRPGQTGHYRNGIWGLETIESQPYVRTVSDVFEFGLSISENEPCLGYRPMISANPLKFADHYVWDTYAEVNEHRKNIGSALHKLFKEGMLGGGEYETVGLWSQNRPEWQQIDLALHAYAKVGVSLYDTLGKDSVEYVIQHAHLSVVFATAQHISSLLSLAPRLPMLRLIVSIDALSPELRRLATSWATSVNVKVMDLDEIKEMGKANRIEPIPASPDQICTINYTSGTTSAPKGVVLTHKNLTAASVANMHGIEFDDKGLLLSYLPLAHIYERINEMNLFSNGGAIGYFTGDPLRLLEDVNILKPNYFPSVPRVLNRIYQGAMQAARAPGLRGAIFRTALDAKLKKLRETGDNTHAFWDRIVFRKVKAVLGGRVGLLTSGSAPISPDALDFLKVAFACEVIEGYGMTENCGTSHRCWPNDPTSTGFVGALHTVNEMKLIDIPSMNYSAEDKPFPRGEICMRGDNVFKFYYKDEKSTRETIDEEGWMHTGDVGEIDQYGRLKIIDRVKNILKLSQGEYVALEKIESVYSSNPLVAQICVYGDSLRDHVVAIVVPDPVIFAELSSKVTGATVRADDAASLAAAATDRRVVYVVFETLAKEAKRAGLKGFESIKNLHITMDMFTPDNRLLTPTLKVRRRDVYTRYREVLDGLYAESVEISQPAGGPKL